MLEKLSRTFQQALTTEQREDPEKYYWFRTDHEELFGLKREALSQENYVLMQQLFEEVMTEQSIFTSSEQKQWYHFLYEDGKLPSSWQMKKMRLYYVSIPSNEQEDLCFETILKENFPQLTVLKPSACCFILLDLDVLLDRQEFETLIQAFIADTLVPVYRFSGQLHAVNDLLKEKLLSEVAIFQQHITGEKKDALVSFTDIFPFHHAKRRDMLATPLLDACHDSETAHMIHVLCDCNLNSSLAAKRLFIHRNSLQYRLERFLQQTDLDLRIFSHAMFALVALKL